MKICVVGTGYVGLVAGVCLAALGHEVTCADIDPEKITALRAGRIPIHEPGLAELLAEHRARFRATLDVRGAIAGAEVVFIAVGTPPRADGAADLGAVLAVAATIGEAATRPLTVVTKSTVPVGTADRVAATLRRHGSHHHAVVSNPEFLREGRAVHDFLHPDRIVVGVDDARAADVMRAVYAPLLDGTTLHVMDVRSSEMTKYAANAMLATRISFINEIAALCDAVGADVEHVRAGMGSDARIGPHFLAPGCGYGGSCFPKDVRALVTTARENGVRLGILDAVEETNHRQKQRFAASVVDALGAPRGKAVAVWGLAFKPDTDDMREAPSRVVVERLLAAGCAVRVHDPVALGTGRAAFADLGDGIVWCHDAYACVEGADALVICTEWSAFRAPDFARLRALMRSPLIVDGRNLYDPETLRGLGFDYRAIGRGRLNRAADDRATAAA
ncbi:MAG: UDP-glucose/GDP-mannose dehydrogenase family protein [bacterium]